MVELQERLSAELGERYAIERELGRGGMATVYLAHDRQDGRDVAIKVLHPDLAAAVGAERFRREIEIATRLQHPHILSVWHAGEAAGSLYCVMPVVRGESLRALLERERQLSLEDAIRLTCEVCEALAYAHANGVVHRDIKPENILLENGHAVVADFGIARAVSDTTDAKLTQTGMALGTPAYMSPEQVFADRPVDGRSDIYSLGCVLYELLAGVPPFTGGSAHQVMARHTLDQVPSVSIVRDNVPEHVEDALMRALSKTAADRFPTARDFAAALRAPGATRGVRRVPRLAHADRRQHRPRRVLYTALSLLLPLGALGYAGWKYLRPAPAVAGTAASDAALRRVAVLYFDDLSAGGRLGEVADGLTDALIDELARVPALTVVSRNGVAPFRGVRADAVDSVADLLRVGLVVRGSVDAEAGDAVAVSVRLVDATGDEIDRVTVTRPRGELLAVRDSLAGRVAEFLRERAGVEVALQRTRAGTRSVAAWTLHQRAEKAGRTADARWRAGDTSATIVAFTSADSLFTEAERADPAWVAPTVGRGFVAYRRAFLSAEPFERQRLVADGLAHAERALARAPEDPAALELRGSLRLYKRTRGLEPDPTAARQLLVDAIADLRRATTLDSTAAGAWERLSVAHAEASDMAGAVSAARHAYEADAYLANASDVLLRLYSTAYDAQQFPAAQKWCDEGYARFAKLPAFTTCRLWLLSVRGQRPDVERAWRMIDELRALTPAQEWPFAERRARMLVAGGIGRAGLMDSALRVLERSRGSARLDPDGDLATIEIAMRAILGDRDGAFRLIQMYLVAHPDHRDGLARSTSWWWDDLRDDPRWAQLVGSS